jgi:hypothetical protein
MPAWPKSFHTFGVNLRTAATEWKLRNKRGAPAAQEKALRALTTQLAPTKFWRQAGIEARMNYAAFQKRVPLCGYEQLAPAIERMKAGEADVLTPGRCPLFVVSSGTSGEPKHLPLTDAALAHFRRAWMETLLIYTVRVKHARVFRGRHLYVGGSTALVPVDGAPPPLHATELPGVVELSLPRWMEKDLYEPGAAIARLADWQPKLEAIVQRTRQTDISLLAGSPSAAIALAQAAREAANASGATLANLQARWPRLECFVHRGVPLAPFYDALRAMLGPTVKFHEAYMAPEGLFAAQDGEPAAGLRVLADAGLFFEFVPLTDFDESRPETASAKAVPLSGVKTGINYVLAVTTPAGLARYVVGDVVRFTSVAPPRLLYVGRTRLRLHAFNEGVIERELTDALVAVCQRHAWTIVNFHVAPLFTASNIGQQRGRHEWWVELKPGTVATPTGPQIAAALDAELLRLNPDYTAKRRLGIVDAPFVRLVMPGVFEHWLRHHGKWGGEHKLPRCRSDRLIADELAQITNFARD